MDSGKWRSPARALWAHGGALTSGSGGWAWYNGARLAAANQIVIVTMNYRLGPLGFLHPGDLNRDLGPGNLGILDVMLALEWTAWNIAAFGGDPETITVGGQSAGAHLAGLLAASSRTRSMVRRLILQSGGLTSKVPSPADATAVAREYFDVLGVDVADTSAVRALEESRFVEAYDSMIRQRAGSGIALPIGPTRATDAPWTDLSAALKEGADSDLDVLVGVTSDEANAFVHARSAMSEDQAKSALDELTDGAGALTYDHYADRRPGGAPWTRVADALTDRMFRRPALDLAHERDAGGRPAFVYEFTWSANDLGATHCIDLPFLFGRLEAWSDSPMLAGAESEELENLAASFGGAIGAFVRTGRPEHSDFPSGRRIGSTFHG